MSSGHQHIKWRRNIAENFNRLSRVHERYRHTTDRRQTDGRTTTYSEHEHEFTFANNTFTTILFYGTPHTRNSIDIHENLSSEIFSNGSTINEKNLSEKSSLLRSTLMNE